MKNLLLITVVTIATLFLVLVGYAERPVNEIPPVEEAAFAPVKKTMRPFRSEQDLLTYFHELAEKHRRESRRGAPLSVFNAQPNASTQAESIAGVAKSD